MENFDEISLSHTVKEIEGNFCFSIFGENSKWPPFLGEGKIYFKLPIVHTLDTLWVENFDEIALSHTVKETEANFCFSILGKNSKIQNGRHFGGEENILKIANSTFLRYPLGRKFRRNRFISHSLGDRHIYVFCYVTITQEVKAITTNNNTKQAIDAINLHTKF